MQYLCGMNEKRQQTIDALRAAGGDRKEAAKLLGISYQGLLQRVRRWLADEDLPPPPNRGRRRKAGRLSVAAQRLAEDNLHVVDRIAATIAKRLPKSIDPEDLVQSGRVGLLDAAARFDPSRGVKFETYCPGRIHGAIMDWLRDNDHVPRTIRLLQKQRVDAAMQLQREGVEPTREAVCERLGWSEPQYEESLPAITWEMSLLEGAGASYREAIGWDGPDKSAFCPTHVDEIPAWLARATAAELLQSLSIDELVIVYLYWWKGQTLARISEAMQLSQSRISQLHSGALERLRLRGRERFLEAAA